MNNLPFLVTIDGVIELNMRLPGAMRFGACRCRRARSSRRLLVEVAHLVVEDHAGAAHDDVRAEAAFERERVRHRIPPFVHDREMRRLFAFVLRGGDLREDVLSEIDASGRVRGIDRRGERLRVGFRRQLRDRHVLHEVRIAEVSARSRYARRIASIWYAASGGHGPSFGRLKCSRMLSISTIATPPLDGGGMLMIRSRDISRESARGLSLIGRESFLLIKPPFAAIGARCCRRSTPCRTPAAFRRDRASGASEIGEDDRVAGRPLSAARFSVRSD
jgi:hypothetical protein